jgi:hypothetical protein
MPPRIETRFLASIGRLAAALERHDPPMTNGDQTATICNSTFIIRNRFWR